MTEHQSSEEGAEGLREWRSIEGHEGRYEVSNEGEVRSLPRPRTRGGILKPNLTTNGYRFVTLSGVSKNVHVLVAEAFHGARPEGLVVRHLNGEKLDNRAENLKWGTWRENEMDKFDHGVRTKATHCQRGHELTPDNLAPCRGSHQCRRCKNDLAKARSATGIDTKTCERCGAVVTHRHLARHQSRAVCADALAAEAGGE